jgi:hypothetical protein
MVLRGLLFVWEPPETAVGRAAVVHIFEEDSRNKKGKREE